MTSWAWLEVMRGKNSVAVSPAPVEPDHVQSLVDKVTGLMKSEPLTWTRFLAVLTYKPSVIEEPLITIHNSKEVSDVYLEILRHDGKKEDVDKLTQAQRNQLVVASRDLEDWIRQAQAEALIKNIDAYTASVDIAEAVGSHQFPHSAVRQRGK